MTDSTLFMNLGLAYISLEKNQEALNYINANLRFAGPFTDEAGSLISKINQKSKEK